MTTKFSTASLLTLAFAAMAAIGQEGTIRNQSELKHALATAKTPADHARIAYYYHSAARTYSQSETDEEAIAARWQKQYEGWEKTPNPYQSAKALAAWYRTQAGDALRRATEQDKLAGASIMSLK